MKALLLLVLSSFAFGAASPTRPFTMAIIDTSSTNITTGYDGANAKVLDNLASPGNLLVWNETGDNIGVSVPASDTCVVSSPDHYVAPGVTSSAAGLGVDNVAINKIVCLRSLSGGTINTGTVYISVW